MKIQVIGCAVFAREVEAIAANLPHLYRFMWIPQAFHDKPDVLRRRLQCEIDRAVDVDFIVLLYGLCGMAVVGLLARNIPIVIARVEDCLGMLLGAERYRAARERFPHEGIYWLFPGWLDEAFLPTETQYLATDAVLDAKYGADNAQFLGEMNRAWAAKFSRCGVIVPAGGLCAKHALLVEEIYTLYIWKVFTEVLSTETLKGLLSGEWGAESCLICPKGGIIRPSWDRQLFFAEVSLPE